MACRLDFEVNFCITAYGGMLERLSKISIHQADTGFIIEILVTASEDG
jgi:hypothetical protein